MSVNREEHGKGVLQAIRNLLANVPGVRLVEAPWQDWGMFRHQVAGMDLCLQLSATETFNLTTADAAAAGVPSVVGSSITWVPPSWHAEIDSPEHAARVGSGLLGDPKSGQDGRDALAHYLRESIAIWLRYLGESPARMQGWAE